VVIVIDAVDESRSTETTPKPSRRDPENCQQIRIINPHHAQSMQCVNLSKVTPFEEDIDVGGKDKLMISDFTLIIG